MGLQHNKFVGQCMSPTDNVVHFLRIKETLFEFDLS